MIAMGLSVSKLAIAEREDDRKGSHDPLTLSGITCLSLLLDFVDGVTVGMGMIKSLTKSIRAEDIDKGFTVDDETRTATLLRHIFHLSDPSISSGLSHLGESSEPLEPLEPSEASIALIFKKASSVDYVRTVTNFDTLR